MSRLLFAPIDEAFYLRSDNIKDTQSEIEKLKKIITEGTIVKKSTPPPPQSQNQNQIEKRVGYSDKVVANFDNFTKKNEPDMDILKIMQHPKFDDIVKNYIIVKNPEWINKTLKETVNVKENFGKYATTNSGNIQNYIIFFTISLIVYLLLEKLLKPT